MSRDPDPPLSTRWSWRLSFVYPWGSVRDPDSPLTMGRSTSAHGVSGRFNSDLLDCIHWPHLQQAAFTAKHSSRRAPTGWHRRPVVYPPTRLWYAGLRLPIHRKVVPDSNSDLASRNKSSSKFRLININKKLKSQNNVKNAYILGLMTNRWNVLFLTRSSRWAFVREQSPSRWKIAPTFPIRGKITELIITVVSVTLRIWLTQSSFSHSQE